ncbi:hypothetical protein CPLU01_14710 [Colletotrichum plurivorum]|uniref:DUF6536 domain-containing protein n=1 Tax=Colletotrichum plurivorum TaxID=2175906 RepID=A0A8H6JIL0_9PEZI|nr:hypothetical protein CPLU01_14710 [Colletotrichum plurivorum]
MSTCATILLGILITAVAKTGELKQAWLFFKGDCRQDSTKTTNTLLHLLINALSTVVLASSNFFMQVLNAPSRRELDAAHARGKWLDIGILSWRNAISLSKFKLAARIALCLTSIPIHMLFNSPVFQMTSRFGSFNVVVASEGFLRGEPYYFPGAYLRLQEAARAPGWERLDMLTCQRIYNPGPCTGLTAHRNVVIVVDGSGWRRGDMWNTTVEVDEGWEPFIPRDELNPLLPGLQCNMSGSFLGSQESLVTPGDAVASFISMQDEGTIPGPVTQDMKWAEKRRPRAQAVPRGVWFRTYAILLIGFAALPYKHSVPLLVLSTLGHWLVSNALFVIVSQGSYYSADLGSNKDYASDHTSLPADAVVAIGTASLPVLILTVLGAVMILWPILLSRKALPGYMPIVGSNSLAIMAACRVSPLAQVPREDGHEIGEVMKQVAHSSVDRTPADDTTQDTELEELVPPAETSPKVKEGCGGAVDIALHPLKWGQVKMPEDWYTQEGQDLDNVGHLSFGTVLDDPQPPVNGRWYR